MVSRPCFPSIQQFGSFLWLHGLRLAKCVGLTRHRNVPPAASCTCRRAALPARVLRQHLLLELGAGVCAVSLVVFPAQLPLFRKPLARRRNREHTAGPCLGAAACAQGGGRDCSDSAQFKRA